jgi:hypothetical protein
MLTFSAWYVHFSQNYYKKTTLYCHMRLSPFSFMMSDNLFWRDSLELSKDFNPSCLYESDYTMSWTAVNLIALVHELFDTPSYCLYKNPVLAPPFSWRVVICTNLNHHYLRMLWHFYDLSWLCCSSEQKSLKIFPMYSWTPIVTPSN